MQSCQIKWTWSFHSAVSADDWISTDNAEFVSLIATRGHTWNSGDPVKRRSIHGCNVVSFGIYACFFIGSGSKPIFIEFYLSPYLMVNYLRVLNDDITSFYGSCPCSPNIDSSPRRKTAWGLIQWYVQDPKMQLYHT